MVQDKMGKARKEVTDNTLKSFSINGAQKKKLAENEGGCMIKASHSFLVAILQYVCMLVKIIL